MKRLTTDELRARFLDFFVQRAHALVASDSLVPSYDPSLLFSGAGMNQFKDEFLGKGRRTFKRACSSQKCLRTGDIDNVGVTPAHQTFFEMLGNFSFGDYFKREAIAWGWEFCTGVLELPEERLNVSVYQDDEEAYGLWRKEVGLPEGKIYRLGAHDNFWPADAPEQAPAGQLCGPCSEIYYDLGPTEHCPGEKSRPDCDCRRHVEIWNLVFQQFQKGAKPNELHELPRKNIDTGAGLERMAAVLQGVPTNFEIDILLPLVEEVLRMADSAGGHKYLARYAEQRKRREPPGELLAVLRRARRVADHARAVTFCLFDCLSLSHPEMPSNEGRGYVMRRLLRRAVMDGRALGIKESFVYSLVAPVAKLMRRPYPEIEARSENLARLIKAEEENFQETLDRGRSIRDETSEKKKRKFRIGNNINNIIEKAIVPDGRDAFTLYDTYGFPMEITEDEWRERVRASSATVSPGIPRDVEEALDVPRTELVKDWTQGETARVLAIFEQGRRVNSVDADPNVNQEGVLLWYSKVEVILDRTPFCPESGGQGGNWGHFYREGRQFVEVEDVRQVGGIIIHEVLPTQGTLSVGDLVEPRVFRAEFDAAMNEQRERARAGSKMVGADIFGGVMAEVKGKVIEAVGSPKTEFVRNWPPNGKAKVLAIFRMDKNELLDSVAPKNKPGVRLPGFPAVRVVLDKTPFYGEAGGQVGDKGLLYKDGHRVAMIDETTRADEIILHLGMFEAKLSVGDEVEPRIDSYRRADIEANHTATHILHHYLRQVLGKHVEQSGSLVDDQRLRLDFTHFEAMKPEELRRVEELVNAAIRAGGSVKTAETTVDEAKKAGAMALFGEKYGERVRMVQTELGGGERSVELCGGTHLENVGDARLFRIEREESVAAGIRRITATTGTAAEKNAQVDRETLSGIDDCLRMPARFNEVNDPTGAESRKVIVDLCALLKCQRENLVKRIDELKALAFRAVEGEPLWLAVALQGGEVERVKLLLKDAKESEKREQSARASNLAGRGKQIAEEAVELASGARFASAALEGLGPDDLRRLADEVRALLPSGIIFLASNAGGKALLVAAVSEDLVKAGKKAGDIVKAAAKEVGGGGGGKPSLAQAGGPNADKIPEAIAAARKFAES